MGLLRRLSGILTADHRWKRVRFAFGVWLQDPTLHPLEVHQRFDADLCERMFFRNHELLHLYAKRNGGRAVTYLQPFNGVGSRSMSPRDAANLAHLRRRVTADGTSELDAMYGFYRRLIAEFQKRADKEFVDLTAILDRVPSDVYIDQVHCSDVGYDLIARRIADDILERDAVRPEAS